MPQQPTREQIRKAMELSLTAPDPRLGKGSNDPADVIIGTPSGGSMSVQSFPRGASLKEKEEEAERAAKKRVSREREEELIKGFERIPRDVELALAFAPPTPEDRLNALEHIYGAGNVEYLPHSKIHVVKSGGKILKTDEPEFTLRDIEDVGYGVAGISPEIAGGTAATMAALSKFPQAPVTKLGTLGLAATGALGAEATGAVKDYLFRKVGIKTDPKTGEIIKRRAGGAALGTLLGYGAGRVLGAGRLTGKEGEALKKLSDVDPKLVQPSDALIAEEGKEAAKALGIRQTAGRATLDPGVVRVESHARRALERVPSKVIGRPAEVYDQSERIGMETARREIGAGATGREDLGKRIGKELKARDESLAASAQREADVALREAGEDVAGVGVSRSAAADPDAVGQMMQGQMRQRLKTMSDDVTKQYESVEKELSKLGIGQFAEFKNLREAIKKWRKEQAPKKRTPKQVVTEESTIVGGTPKEIIKDQEKRVATGEFGEADNMANEWLKISKEPQTLGEAQTFISRLGELTRQGGTQEVGTVGFGRKALRDFYQAAKKDLGDSFDNLNVDASLRTRWNEANKAHKNKVEAFNSSAYIQNAIRESGEGGVVNPRQLVSQLTNGTGDTGNLRLLKKIFNDDISSVRAGVVDDMIGSRTVELADGSQLVDLSALAKKINSLDDAFLKELLDEPGKKSIVPDLRKTLGEWEKVHKAHGSIGISGRVNLDDFQNALKELESGSPSTARRKMADIAKKEAERRDIYYNELIKDYKSNSFELIQADPEMFIDDVLLRAGAKEGHMGRRIFNELPSETQEEVRRHMADRIMSRAMDIRKTPISRLISKEGEIIDPKKLVNELFGDATRKKTILQILNPEQREAVTNMAKYAHARARYDQIAGSAGAMATETAIGGGSILSMGGQLAFGRAVFGDVMQDFLSSGATGNTTILNKLFSIMAKDPAALTIGGPSRKKMMIALSGAAPTSDQVISLAEKGLKARAELEKEYGETGAKFFDETFGEIPRREQIRRAMERDLED
tara:strand:+ start:1156 stop:4239 length:3084 start_codon:yes stop_codon:yes gene_type:complete